MSTIKVNIKPLSINKAFQGRRFKTKDYNEYEKACLLMMPRLRFPQGKVALHIRYGFSNKASDVDNPTKLVLDIMQKKYKFNDKDVYEIHLASSLVLLLHWSTLETFRLRLRILSVVLTECTVEIRTKTLLGLTLHWRCV